MANKKLTTLEDLFWMQVGDVYDAETQLTKALPKMAEAAHNPKLKQAFKDHLQETREQAERLETIFDKLGHEKDRVTCEAMKGLIKEGEEIIKADGQPDVKDAALIAAAQRVEHYEISAYGTLRAIADRLQDQRAAELLRDTLGEEREADRLLNLIAKEQVNPRASRAEQ